MTMRMTGVLLIFATMTAVYCQTNCPSFASFPNANGLENALTGTFLVVYTSANVIDCQRAIYVVVANNALTAYVESPGCCMLVQNFVFNPNQLNYTIGPVSGYTPTCPGLNNENGSMKLLSTWGSGSSLCLIVAVCQPNYYGINVLCRGQAPLLIDIIALLFNVLGLLQADKILALQSVSQSNCVFESNNCPGF